MPLTVIVESLVFWVYLIFVRARIAQVMEISPWYAFTTPLGAAVFAAMMITSAKEDTEDAIVDAINGIKLAAADPNADAALLDQARDLHRKSQFMWDFVSAENSTGFHNPEYALKILAKSTNLARQAQMLAAQSI